MSSANWAFDDYQRWQGLHRDVDRREARRLVNRLLTNNRVFSAYAIANPNGEILLTSENIDENVGRGGRLSR